MGLYYGMADILRHLLQPRLRQQAEIKKNLTASERYSCLVGEMTFFFCSHQKQLLSFIRTVAVQMRDHNIGFHFIKVHEIL